MAEGEEAKQDVRTSFGFWPDSDDVTTRITERIHRTLGIPHDFGEGLYGAWWFGSSVLHARCLRALRCVLAEAPHP